MNEPPSNLVMPQSPPPDLHLNTFLLRVADEIEQDDLEKVKFLLSGDKGFSTKTAEKIGSPLDLFTELKKRALISRHDILYLQLILEVTGKKKAIQLACDFARETGNTLHFFPPPECPAHGYSYVKLHVNVPDVQRYTRQTLEELRRKVSSMVFAPESSIHIVGVELQSILVTFMVPSVYAEILEDIIERNDHVDAFQELTVDWVSVHDTTYTIDLKDPLPTDTDNENTELISTENQSEKKHHDEDYKSGYMRLANEMETIKMVMKHKEEETATEINKLKEENANLLSELTKVKQRRNSGPPRINGIKNGEWREGGSVHSKLTAVIS